MSPTRYQPPRRHIAERVAFEVLHSYAHARWRGRQFNETHVRVGDHDPEPRAATRERINWHQVETIHAMSPTNQFFPVGDPRRVINSERRQ